MRRTGRAGAVRARGVRSGVVRLRATWLGLACTALVLSAGPASAQQTVNFNIGYFAPQGADARVGDDVLLRNQNFLIFDVRDFGGATVGAEWLVPFGRFVEGGAGIAFSRRTVPSIYADYVDTDGTEVDQDLRLRLVPVTFSLRVVPFGTSSPVQPYLGVGVGVVSWRYSETGEFIDFSGGQRTIFRDRYVATGRDVGRVVLGGIRFAGDRATSGFEIRHQRARGELDDRFAGSQIDLGGWTYQLTVGARF
jgi:hypothetical protein